MKIMVQINVIKQIQLKNILTKYNKLSTGHMCKLIM